MSNHSVGDHWRVTTAEIPAGTYRVVGTDAEGLTMLRVTDADGRRAHTGEIVRVERNQLDGFERASAPGGTRGGFEAVYWSVRTFVGELTDRPVVTLLALGVVSVGLFADLSGTVGGVAVLVGSLALAAVGSGRL